MAGMLTELERKLPRRKPFRGLCETWAEAMRVAAHVSSQTGRRHRVTFCPSHLDTQRWAVREVEAPGA